MTVNYFNLNTFQQNMIVTYVEGHTNKLWKSLVINWLWKLLFSSFLVFFCNNILVSFYNFFYMHIIVPEAVWVVSAFGKHLKHLWLKEFQRENHLDEWGCNITVFKPPPRWNISKCTLCGVLNHVNIISLKGHKLPSYSSSLPKNWKKKMLRDGREALRAEGGVSMASRSGEKEGLLSVGSPNKIKIQ